MTRKKKTVTPKKRSTTKAKLQPKKVASRFDRFLKAFTASAIASFSIASCAFNPQWPEELSLEPLLGQLSPQGHEQVAAPIASAQGLHQTRFAQCPQFFPGRELPAVPAAGALRELCFTSFAILHSGQTKTPVFVAQRLNRRMLSQTRAVARTNRFYADARLPQAERAELADYRGSGYSRGHMAPAGDMHNAQAMAQSFSLANMVPQNQRHNAGAWSRIEQDTRKYVMRASGDVFIFTGPFYATRPATIGAGRVAVPSHLFKVVHDPAAGRSWVHWQANRADTKAGPPISYAEFVQRTGLHLLPGATR